MIAGARVEFWIGLGVAMLLGALELGRRIRAARRFYLGALLEQVRREQEHTGPSWRADQRVRAIQQRLSRRWGRLAFLAIVRRRVERDSA